MTSDFKNILLKFLTNNLTKQNGNNIPNLGEYNQNNGNIRNAIATELQIDYEDVVIYRVLYSSVYNKFVVLVRNTSVSPTQILIAIIDENFELVQIIDHFNNNASFFFIIMLNIDESGNFYGISRDDSTNRVLLFNNILASGEKTGNYEVILRQSYIIPSSYNFTIGASSRSNYVIVKAKNEAVYYITGYDSTSSSTLKVIKFQINVGSTNTWDIYSYANGSQPSLNNSVLLQKTNNGLIYKLFTLYSSGNNYYYREFTINENGNVSLSKEIILDRNFSWLSSQVLALSENNVYIVLSENGTTNSYIYKVNDSVLSFIYSSTGYTSSPLIYLNNVNNLLFVSETISQNNNYNKQQIGVLSNDVIYFTDMGLTNNQSTVASATDFLITNSYNLFNIYVISDTTDQGQTPVYINKTLQLVYNNNNYNGASYENVNSLVPNSAVLLNDDEDPKIIFARNLYNKIINNNTTVSTVQIPNTLLNSDNIQNKSLYSQTNTVLDFDMDLLTKNIYETLNINFFNTIDILNNNNTNNPIYNTLGAIRLNNSISNVADYDDATLNKIKINYTDNTNEIKTIAPATINNGVATYNFAIYVPKEIDNIQMISNDENTVYQTITGTFGLNKYYSLTQEVRIE